MIKMRLITKDDWQSTWKIIKPVFMSGETYPYDPKITQDEAYQIWIKSPKATYVAVDKENNILGTYYIKSNQPALGSHVCNCGYIVSEQSRGKGLATTMCEHSQKEALSLGYTAMQYNLVVSTNEGAVRLWSKLGFETVGTLPKAFRHPRFGEVDAHIMYKLLSG